MGFPFKMFGSAALNVLQFLPLLIHQQQTVQPAAPGVDKFSVVMSDLQTLLATAGQAGDIFGNPAKIEATTQLVNDIVKFKNAFAAADAAAPAPAPRPGNPIQ